MKKTWRANILNSTLEGSSAVRHDAELLSEMETTLAEVVAQVARERDVTHAPAAVVHGFDKRLHDVQASAGWRTPVLSFGAVSAIAVASLLVFLPSSGPEQAPSEAFAPRGDLSNAETILSGLCVTTDSGEPRSAESSTNLSCSIEDGLQVTLRSPTASADHVAVFAMLYGASGGLDVIPYSPNPGATAPIVLAPTGAAQTVGLAHLLGTNHQPGHGWLVAVGASDGLSWEEVEPLLEVWQGLPASFPLSPALISRVVVQLEEQLDVETSFVVVRRIEITPAEE